MSLSHVSRRTTAEKIKESSEHRSSLTNFPMLNDASQDKQQTLAQYNHLGVSNRHTPPPPPLPPRPVLRNQTSTSPVHSFTHSTRYILVFVCSSNRLVLSILFNVLCLYIVGTNHLFLSYCMKAEAHKSCTTAFTNKNELFTIHCRPTPPDRFNDGVVHQRTASPAFSSNASSQLTSRNMALREKANRLASGNRELEDCISQLQMISTMVSNSGIQ